MYFYKKFLLRLLDPYGSSQEPLNSALDKQQTSLKLSNPEDSADEITVAGDAMLRRLWHLLIKNCSQVNTAIEQQFWLHTEGGRVSSVNRAAVRSIFDLGDSD